MFVTHVLHLFITAKLTMARKSWGREEKGCFSYMLQKLIILSVIGLF
jgi:hypothetical protein